MRSCFLNVRYHLQLCVQNSPQEARNMLLQNPQLAYALLQAQVVMRIVDPEIALVRRAIIIMFFLSSCLCLYKFLGL